MDGVILWMWGSDIWDGDGPGAMAGGCTLGLRVNLVGEKEVVGQFEFPKLAERRPAAHER